MKINIINIFQRLNKKESIDTFLYTLGNVLTSFLSFLTLPLITRLISPEKLGIFNYTSSIKTFLFTISILSLDSFLLRYFFKLKTADERKDLFAERN